MKKEDKNKLKAQVTIEAINKKTNSTFVILNKINSINNNLEFDKAGALIKVLKEYVKEAKTEENGIAQPLKISLERLKEHFKPFYDRVTEIEDHIKVMMLEYIDKQNKKLAVLDNKVATGKMKNISTYVEQAAELTVDSDSTSVRRVWKAIITDTDKIPREFLVPNVQAITEHLRHGGEPIPGVEWRQINSIAI